MLQFIFYFIWNIVMKGSSKTWLYRFRDWNEFQVALCAFRFKQTAMRISSLLKDRRRTPLQEACDWIEYVLRHGGAKHLRPQVFNIPWYQYYLLDVIAFLVALVTVVVVAIWLTCRCLCRFCCKSKGMKPKREWKKSIPRNSKRTCAMENDT